MAEAITTLDYYDVFEAALSSLASVFDDHRRHFGVPRTPVPDGYCWFKGITAADRHRDFVEWLVAAGDELENRVLEAMPRRRPRSMLDVGCGNGQLLRRLAREQPSLRLVGINSHATQVRTARRLLAGSHAEVVEADFFEHPFTESFDVAYMIESAFHMPDKVALCRRLGEVLTPGGEVWMIDIVVAERAAELFQSVGRGALFNFIPRKEWRARFAAAGFQELEVCDLSQGAASVLTISDIAQLERDYFRPGLATALATEASPAPARLEAAVRMMVRIAHEYRRLSRLLRGGMLQYVLMRYAKNI
jgi:2-polyprenyl-3-methyl-5-hydroxy-6-metoxy-1,4-benzoquinol methylase